MKSIYIDVLGTTYKVVLGKSKEINISKEHLGECRVFAKEILVKTNKEDCTEKELEVRTQEVIAHEIFHAYLNESGIELDECVEEQVANFFMKNWRKMNNSILEVLDKNGYLT